jgi:ribosome-binding ATPase YchF (GTP1/OBG family)
MPHFIKTLKYQSTIEPKVGIVRVPDPRHMTRAK